MLLVTSLNRASANEIYVRQVLQQQIGIHPLELDLLSLHHPQVFRLSVRHSIEPVIQYLRSQGLTGSALAHVISRAPGVLSSSVEEQIMPLCTFLNNKLGTQGMAALLRYPQIVEIAPKVLENGFKVLTRAGASEEECGFFLRKFPELFVRFSAVVFDHNRTSGEEQDGVNNGESEVGNLPNLRKDDEPRLLQMEKLLFYFRALKTVSSSGWDMKIAENELRILIETLGKRSGMHTL